VARRVTATSIESTRDLRLALDLFLSGEVHESAGLIKRVLAIDPANADALQLLAVHREYANHRSGVVVLHRLALLVRSSAHHWLNLAIAQRQTQLPFALAAGSALSLEPDSPRVLRQYSRSLFRDVDSLEVSTRWLHRVAKIVPNDAQIWLDVADGYRRVKDFDAALGFARRAMSLEPNNENALLAVAKHRSWCDRHVDSFFERVRRVAPTDFAVNFAYAEALSRSGRPGTETEMALSRALACCPGRADGLYNLGLMRRDQELLPEAACWIGRAAVLAPGSSAYTVDLGWMLHALGKTSAAMVTLQHAIDRFPNDVHPRRVLGSVALETRRITEATRLFSESLVLDPTTSSHYNKIAMVTLAVRESDCQPARCPLQRALQIDPRSVEALTNYGIFLEREGAFNEACEFHVTALSNAPSLKEPRLNLAICELGLGRFETAWDNYEARWGATSIVLVGRQGVSRKLSTSKSRFEMASKGRVLLWAEQGVGDEIMFASMVPDLQRSCDELIVEVDSRLRPLFERSFRGIQVIARFGDIPESIYDCHLPIGSLGGFFRPTLESFSEQPNGYLHADISLVAHFAQLFASRSKPLVGVSWWSQNPESGIDRSIPLADLLAALGEHVIPLNLQYGAQQMEFERAVAEGGIQAYSIDDIDNQQDLDQLAAMISACDLVISIGNTTAHLAAALGKPTWVLVPLAGSWRWMFHGSTTPWYPSVRLFRRSRGESWLPVLQRVTDALQEFFRGRGQ
jgi:Flp pilus assembly protein TadD